MPKRIIILVCTIAAFSAALFTANAAGDNKKKYYIGEKIVYDVNLGGVHIGKAKFSNISLTTFDSKRADLITFETKVTNFNDLEKIYCDPDTLLPIRVERDIKQLTSRERIVETYNQKNYTLAIKKTKGRKVEELTLKSDSPIQNAILLPFFVRRIPDFHIGRTIKINLPQTKFEIKPVSIVTIRVPAGKFKAYYFESKPAKFKIWISKDERRIPLRIKGLGGFGYTLLMKEYSLK